MSESVRERRRRKREKVVMKKIYDDKRKCRDDATKENVQREAGLIS